MWNFAPHRQYSYTNEQLLSAVLIKIILKKTRGIKIALMFIFDMYITHCIAYGPDS